MVVKRRGREAARLTGRQGLLPRGKPFSATRGKKRKARDGHEGERKKNGGNPE